MNIVFGMSYVFVVDKIKIWVCMFVVGKLKVLFKEGESSEEGGEEFVIGVGGVFVVGVGR